MSMVLPSTSKKSDLRSSLVKGASRKHFQLRNETYLETQLAKLHIVYCECHCSSDSFSGWMDCQ